MNAQDTSNYLPQPEPGPEIKKCSRCRVKRVDETPELLNKYATCASCRAKRKVIKIPLDISNVPNMFPNYEEFVNRVRTNTTQDIFDIHFKGETDPLVIRRYDTDIDSSTYQQIGKKLIELYINPLMVETGYRFPVRDYHKATGKHKKLSFTFICSQDRGRQRKSRSTDQRAVQNKLKTQLCNSKISLNYSLTDGIVTIHYNHKAHSPYSWKRTREEDQDARLEALTGSNRSTSNYLSEQYQEQTRNALQGRQQFNQLPPQSQLQLPSINQRYNMMEPSNSYSNQLQNLTNFNQQLHFAQFHLPLTQYQSQTSPVITSMNSNNTTSSSATTTAAVEQALTTGLPLPHPGTGSNSSASLVSYTVQSQVPTNTQINLAQSSSIQQPLQPTIHYNGLVDPTVGDNNINELNDNEKKTINNENIDKALIGLENS